MASRKQLFNAQFITREVSRVMANSSFLIRLFGMFPGGRNIGYTRTRTGAYDIFNSSRKALPNTAPGASSPSGRRTPVGSVAYSVAQFKKKVPMVLDELHNYRRISGNTTEVDQMGARLIRKERDQLALEAANSRAAMVGGMLRGQLYVSPPSNEGAHYLSWSSITNGFSMDFQIPAGNKAQLNMTDQAGNSIYGANIIDASWATATTDIPTHINKINAAFQQIYGGRLELMIGNYTLWSYLVKNDFVQEAAGTSNTPYTVYNRSNEVDPQSEMPNIAFEARFKAFPHIRVIIIDEGLELGAPGSEAYEKFIPNDYVWFGPDPSGTIGRELFEMLEYEEPTSDGPNKPAVLRRGVYGYGVDMYDPARVDLHIQDNAIPALYNPYATAFAQVAGF